MGLLPRDEDEHLARIWQEHFGTPIPVHGAPSLARRILLEHGVEIPPQPDARKQHTEPLTSRKHDDQAG